VVGKASVPSGILKRILPNIIRVYCARIEATVGHPRPPAKSNLLRFRPRPPRPRKFRNSASLRSDFGKPKRHYKAGESDAAARCLVATSIRETSTRVIKLRRMDAGRRRKVSPLVFPTGAYGRRDSFSVSPPSKVHGLRHLIVQTASLRCGAKLLAKVGAC
jgi:hypothetical protein